MRSFPSRIPKVVQTISAVTALGCVFGLSCGLGAYAAFAAMAASLVLLVNPVSWPMWRVALANRAVVFFILAYGLIIVAMLWHTAHGGEWRYIFDFLPLGLSVPVAIGFLHLKSARWLEIPFLLALAGSLLAFGVVAFEFFVLGDPRPGGLENSPIHFSTLALTLGFVAASRFVARPRSAVAFYLFGPVFGTAAALLTGTRAALPSLIVLCLALAVAGFVFNNVPWRRAAAYLAAGLVGVLGLIAIVALLGGGGRAIEELGPALAAVLGDGAVESSVGYRIEQYGAFFPAFADAPFFGHGWHNQLTAIYPYLSAFGQQGYAEQGWGYIHNEALSMTLGMGLLGLVAYGLIFFAPVAGLMQIRTDPDYPLRCTAIVMVIAGIFTGGITDVLFMAELVKVFFTISTVAFLCIGRGDVIYRDRPNLRATRSRKNL